MTVGGQVGLAIGIMSLATFSAAPTDVTVGNILTEYSSNILTEDDYLILVE